MTEIIELEQIKKALETVDLVEIMEDGFKAYSDGRVVAPPVGELIFEEPPGDMHIKYGYIKDDDYYVIKIASGFYRNPALGLPSSQGLSLLFCQKTGSLKAVLLDEGHLTDLRTAAAGAVAAKYLAPKNVRSIGVVGAGTQAKLQLTYLAQVVECRKTIVWTPTSGEAEPFLAFFEESDFDIQFTDDLGEIARKSNLIVTATPSKTPLIKASDINPGAHITAVGSDTAEKIELEPEILQAADIVAVDSLSQAATRGEVFRAVRAGKLGMKKVMELGALIAAGKPARHDDEQITVADLTGVVVQDIQIAKAVAQNLDLEMIGQA